MKTNWIYNYALNFPKFPKSSKSSNSKSRNPYTVNFQCKLNRKDVLISKPGYFGHDLLFMFHKNATGDHV